MAWCSAVHESKPRLLSDGPTDARGIFVGSSISRNNRDAAARQTLALLARDPQATNLLMHEARRCIFIKGTDSHDYKFSSAVLEDFYHVAPAWRNRFLAASMFWLRGSGGPDSPVLHDLTRQLIDARDNRNPRIIAKLNELGVAITMAEVQEQAGGDVVGRPHIAAVLVRKGTTAIVNVTEAHKAGVGGLPGFVSFEAESLSVDGATVKLRGTAAKEGREVQVNPVAIGLAMIPAGLLLVHGNEADIKAGSVFMATVAEDTPLPSTMK